VNFKSIAIYKLDVFALISLKSFRTGNNNCVSGLNRLTQSVEVGNTWPAIDQYDYLKWAVTMQ